MSGFSLPGFQVLDTLRQTSKTITVKAVQSSLERTVALTFLRREQAANPNEVRAQLALGNLYAQQLREPAQARRHYLKVLELDPHNAQATDIRFWLSANPD